MSYRYEFDDTWDGNLRLRHASYEILQGAYRGLRDDLEAWNRRALEHGGSTPPYEQEVHDLNRMHAWGGRRWGGVSMAHTTAGATVLGLGRWERSKSVTGSRERGRRRARGCCRIRGRGREKADHQFRNLRHQEQAGPVRSQSQHGRVPGCSHFDGAEAHGRQDAEGRRECEQRVVVGAGQ